MKITFAIVTLLLAAALNPPEKKITLWLIGDSTMSVKETNAYPETGWGMPFVFFWDSTVTVDNRAKNGRSTRTFIEENRWKPVTEQMKAGDFVFVQFGHNDEVPTKGSYTTETAFAANLIRYVADTREKGATPVLLTPVARRKFDSTGHIVGTHDAYSAIVRTVATQTHTVLIDLDKLSQDLLQSWGAAPSALLFNHLIPGEHPNYPEGKEDNTHFNELGARVMAELVLKEIRRQLPELSGHIKTIAAKK